MSSIFWTRPPVAGGGPTPRGGQSSALLGASQMLVFGGTHSGERGAFVYCNDLWALDTATTPMLWHKPAVAGAPPAPRYGHGCCVLGGNRMYIFGGKGAGGALLNDLWELDVEAWAWKQCISTTAPPSPRLGHSQVAVGGRIVVFGGWDGAVANNELWAYDRAALAWSRPRAMGLPPTPRQGHVGVLHNQGGRMLVFGGASYDASGVPTYLRDTRELDLVTMGWGRPRVTGDFPSARAGAATATLANVMVLFGGWHGPAEPPQPAAGTLSMPHHSGMGFGAEAAPGAVIEVPYGQHEGTSLLDLDAGEWVAPHVAGTPPGYRYGSSAVAQGLRLFMWGGWEAGRPVNELLVLDLSALAGGGEAS